MREVAFRMERINQRVESQMRLDVALHDVSLKGVDAECELTPEQEKQACAAMEAAKKRLMERSARGK